MLRCRSISQKAALRRRLTVRLMRPPYKALVNLGKIQSVHIPAPIGANEPVGVQGGITTTHFGGGAVVTHVLARWFEQCGLYTYIHTYIHQV